MQKKDFVDHRTREWANTMFHKLTNSTVFASLLQDIPMRCKGTV